MFLLVQPTFYWLIIAWILFALLPEKHRAGFVLISSLGAFFSIAGPRDFSLLFASLAVTSAFVWWFHDRPLALKLGAALLVLQLASWKVFSSASLSPIPLGLSFYTLQLVAYLVDLSRKQARGANPQEIFLFGSFYPHLISGPVVRWRNWAPQQLRWQGPSRIQFESGVFRICIGLAKKICLSDPCGLWAADVFQFPEFYSSSATIAAGVAFSIQIWADFSGYSDIAVGSSRLFGIELPENFRSPYLSASFSDFWKRWHSTLGFWLRDYVYKPLLGRNASARRKAGAIIATCLLSAFWHGQSFGFFIWGAMHAALLCLEKFAGFGGEKWLAWPFLFRWLWIQSFVVIGWVFFRIPDAGTGWQFFLSLAGKGGGEELNSGIIWIAVLLSFGVQGAERWLESNPRWRNRFFETKRGRLTVGLVCGVLCAVIFVKTCYSSSMRSFIYFRF